MSEFSELIIKSELNKTVLSGKYVIEKTERFVSETKRISAVDTLLTKLFEAFVSDPAARALSKKGDCFKADTMDRGHSFFIRLTEDAFVYYKYVCRGEAVRRNDQRILKLLSESDALKFHLRPISADFKERDFKKLYRLSNDDRVNFPFLNREQEKIVVTEDRNELVQGVAGSGKTNICIDKIVFAACRGYHGRVLYSTYSRGLLIDTKTRLQVFGANLRSFARAYEAGNVIFVDGDRRRAIENKLGVYFTVEDTEKILYNVKRIADFLEQKVDFMLPEDMYAKYCDGAESVVGETYFVKEFLSDGNNHHMAGKLAKLKTLPGEIIYKEIFGMIFGRFDPSSPSDMMSEERYTAERAGSFSPAECAVIYSLAQDYKKHLEKKGLTDNNFLSRKLLSVKENIEKYSLIVLDEAQDMTEVTLYLLSEISAKMCCVGDALQMINPSFFSFSYLKRLLFIRDETTVAELKNNFRNTRKIAEIVNALGDLNVRQFGTHSFVLRGDAVESEENSTAVYVKEGAFVDRLSEKKFENLTVVVSNAAAKAALRKRLKKTEILTVSEIKGLEREVVVLYNLLSDNYDKWQQLERTKLNRKTADENSVYRYYFNLFYVGASRAKNHLYCAETQPPAQFSDFFAKNFTYLSARDAAEKLTEAAQSLELDNDELIDRINQFLKLGQFENARFTSNRITDDKERNLQLNHIEIYEKYIRFGKHRDAGIGYWELGMFEDAKKQFDLSGDYALKDLIDACYQGSDKGLDVGIITFLPDLSGNAAAEKLISEVLKNDLRNVTEKQRDVNEKLKSLKRKK